MFSYIKKRKEEKRLQRSKDKRLKLVYAFLNNPNANPDHFESFLVTMVNFLKA